MVLIILAIAVINLSMGENGLFTRARFAKESYKNAEDNEKDKVASLSNQIDETVSSQRDTKTLTMTEDELDQKIEEKFAELFVAPTFYEGTVVTNTMGASNTTTKVNSFTVTESGKYIINYTGRLRWESESTFSVYIMKGETFISGNTYSNNISFTDATLNATTLVNLTAGDVINIKVYQYKNGTAGTNNLSVNSLKLIRLGA